MYSSVREELEPGLPHQERLKELEWLVGDWIDESSESVIHGTCRWSADKNFLLRDFTIQSEGKPVMTVTQRIGWDPLSKQIKSWVFDSEGGYGDDRLEIGLQIVIEIIDDAADVGVPLADIDGVTVWVGTRQPPDADRAAGAADIFHNNRLTEERPRSRRQ